MSGPDIFISYSREDRAAARHFAECFADEGFSVWWDAALHSGETFDEVIEAALKAAKAVVVLWTPRSVTSRWVRAEATLADRRNKLAPAVIEPCDRPIIFELTHTADLTEWSGDTSDASWQSFVHDLRRLTAKSPASDARAVPKAAPAPPPARAPVPSTAQRFARRQAPPPPPAPRVSEAPSEGVDSVMFALSNLQQAISKSKRGAPVRAEEPEEQEERTQFYTGAHGFNLFGADEFHCLEISDGDKLQKRFIVSPLGIKIGRTAPADVILADARVSRAHCTVELAGDELKVSDLNSTNGTFVDGERVQGEAVLAVGSLLRVGNVTFKHEVRTSADG